MRGRYGTAGICRIQSALPDRVGLAQRRHALPAIALTDSFQIAERVAQIAGSAWRGVREIARGAGCSGRLAGRGCL